MLTFFKKRYNSVGRRKGKYVVNEGQKAAAAKPGEPHRNSDRLSKRTKSPDQSRDNKVQTSTVRLTTATLSLALPLGSGGDTGFPARSSCKQATGDWGLPTCRSRTADSSTLDTTLSSTFDLLHESQVAEAALVRKSAHGNTAAKDGLFLPEDQSFRANRGASLKSDSNPTTVRLRHHDASGNEQQNLSLRRNGEDLGEQSSAPSAPSAPLQQQLQRPSDVDSVNSIITTVAEVESPLIVSSTTRHKPFSGFINQKQKLLRVPPIGSQQFTSSLAFPLKAPLPTELASQDVLSEDTQHVTLHSSTNKGLKNDHENSSGLDRAAVGAVNRPVEKQVSMTPGLAEERAITGPRPAEERIVSGPVVERVVCGPAKVVTAPPKESVVTVGQFQGVDFSDTSLPVTPAEGSALPLAGVRRAVSETVAGLVNAALNCGMNSTAPTRRVSPDMHIASVRPTDRRRPPANVVLAHDVPTPPSPQIAGPIDTDVMLENSSWTPLQLRSTGDSSFELRHHKKKGSTPQHATSGANPSSPSLRNSSQVLSLSRLEAKQRLALLKKTPASASRVSLRSPSSGVQTRRSGARLAAGAESGTSEMWDTIRETTNGFLKSFSDWVDRSVINTESARHRECGPALARTSPARIQHVLPGSSRRSDHYPPLQHSKKTTQVPTPQRQLSERTSAAISNQRIDRQSNALHHLRSSPIHSQPSQASTINSSMSSLSALQRFSSELKLPAPPAALTATAERGLKLSQLLKEFYEPHFALEPRIVRKDLRVLEETLWRSWWAQVDRVAQREMLINRCRELYGPGPLGRQIIDWNRHNDYSGATWRHGWASHLELSIFSAENIPYISQVVIESENFSHASPFRILNVRVPLIEPSPDACQIIRLWFNSASSTGPYASKILAEDIDEDGLDPVVSHYVKECLDGDFRSESDLRKLGQQVIRKSRATVFQSDKPTVETELYSPEADGWPTYYRLDLPVDCLDEEDPEIVCALSLKGRDYSEQVFAGSTDDSMPVLISNQHPIEVYNGLRACAVEAKTIPRVKMGVRLIKGGCVEKLLRCNDTLPPHLLSRSDIIPSECLVNARWHQPLRQALPVFEHVYVGVRGDALDLQIAIEMNRCDAFLLKNAKRSVRRLGPGYYDFGDNEERSVVRVILDPRHSTFNLDALQLDRDNWLRGSNSYNNSDGSLDEQIQSFSQGLQEDDGLSSTGVAQPICLALVMADDYRQLFFDYVLKTRKNILYEDDCTSNPFLEEFQVYNEASSKNIPASDLKRSPSNIPLADSTMASASSQECSSLETLSTTQQNPSTCEPFVGPFVQMDCSGKYGPGLIRQSHSMYTAIPGELTSSKQNLYDPNATLFVPGNTVDKMQCHPGWDLDVGRQPRSWTFEDFPTNSELPVQPTTHWPPATAGPPGIFAPTMLNRCSEASATMNSSYPSEFKNYPPGCVAISSVSYQPPRTNIMPQYRGSIEETGPSFNDNGAAVDTNMANMAVPAIPAHLGLPYQYTPTHFHQVWSTNDPAVFGLAKTGFQDSNDDQGEKSIFLT